MLILEIQTLLFIFARITSFIVVVPGFSHKSLPNTLKIFLGAVLSFLVYTTIDVTPVYPEIVLFTLAMFRETLIGLAMGFSVKLVFSGIEMAGDLIDFQVGYSIGAVYDPTSGVMSSYYGKLFYWLGIMVFFLLDLHHILLKSLMSSFTVMLPGELGFAGFNLEGLLYLFSNSFKIAFSLAAPMLIVLLVTDIVMGLISRTVPQINVFMLGMPLKALIGMVIFLFLVSSFMNHIGKIVMLMPQYMEKMIQLFK